MANIDQEIVLGMLFLTLSSTNVDFLDQELRWRPYTSKETLLTIKRIELIEKKKFAAAALDPKHKIFVVYVASFSSAVSLSSAISLSSAMSLSFTPFNTVYLSCGPQIASLIAGRAPTKIPDKYVNFADVFSPDLASVLSKNTKINGYAIKLVDSQQLPYKPIYSLNLVELEPLKAYIIINLTNEFIRPFKSPAVALIFFDRKSNSFFSFALTIEASTISRLKTGTCCYWLRSCRTD